jgi:hypothetical protein
MSSLADYTRQAGYPTFTPLFDRSETMPVPPYLILLGSLDRPEAPMAIQAVSDAMQASSNLTTEIVALFAEANWRPHIVGAVALLLGAANTETVRALWLALDSGSWTSPQLAVVASRCDPNFEREARHRILAGCPINRERLADLDWATRHSAAGPGSFTHQSGKILSALITLCRDRPTCRPWLERRLEDEDTQQLLKADYDGGGSIADYWREGLQKALDSP